ncbi:hypothetical protein BOQ63_001810 (plasmid) [Streptomyces viridifaciens]|nr:hypothetical protein BOQ63_001810 [Streptomyces viridifaciens]
MRADRCPTVYGPPGRAHDKALLLERAAATAAVADATSALYKLAAAEVVTNWPQGGG